VSALIVWDVKTGCKRHSFEELGAALSFLPDGNSIAVAGNSGTVNVWGLAEGHKLRSLPRPFGPAMSVIFAPSNTSLKEPKLVVSSRSRPRAGLASTGVSYLAQSDPTRQEQIVTSGTGTQKKYVYQPIANGALSVRGKLAGLIELDADAKIRFGFVNSAVESIDAYAPAASCIFALSPSGTLVKGLDRKQGPIQHVVGAVTKGEVAWAMAATADGRWVALAVGSNIQLWDGDKLALRHTLKGHEDAVRSLAFSRNGQLLATAGSDRSVRLWNTSDGSPRATLLGHLKPITCVAFSARGGTVASASYDSTIRLWDTAVGEPKALLTGHVGPVHWIEFSPTGDQLASAGEDGTIRLWKAPGAAEPKPDLNDVKP